MSSIEPIHHTPAAVTEARVLTADEHGVYRPVEEPAHRAATWCRDHPEAVWAGGVGTLLTLSPTVAVAVDAGLAWGAVGTFGAVAGVAIGVGAHKVKDSPTAVALGGAGAFLWGGFTAWASWFPSVSSLAVGAMLTALSGAAGMVVAWRRAGTPIERTQLDHERARLAVELVKLQRLEGVVPDGDGSPDDHDPTRVLPVTRWDGPREGASALDTIEIAPGVFVPVDAHMLIGGTTGGGKSGITDLIVCSLIGRFATRVTGVDMKPGAPELGVYRRAGVKVVTGKDDAAQTVKSLNDEMDRRGAELERLTAETGRKHASWIPTARDPHLFLIVDELTEMLDTFGATEKGLFYRLLRLSRGFAITLICATQSPRAKMFGEDAGASARGQYGVRICLATKQASETRLILDDLAHEPGWKDAHRMPKQGHFLIDAPGHAEPRVYRAFLAGDDMVSDLIDRFEGRTRNPDAAVTPGPLRKALNAPVAPATADPDSEPALFEPASETAVQAPTGTVRDRILAYLGEHPTGRAADMAGAVGSTRETVKAELTRMRKAEILESDGNGGYSLPREQSNVIAFRPR